jgi:LacI family transcriptional regulator
VKKKNKINIVGLSQKLGLSVSSVSRALNGYDNISQKTKDKIFKTAKKYNYFPDLNAKRLASKKIDTIAFISAIHPDAPDHVVLQFLAGITLGIKNTNTELITKFCLNEEEEMNYFKKLISTGQADKFIFYRIKKNDERVTFLNERGIKFVTWGRTNKQKDHAWIDLDNRKSIEILINKLSNNGHERIAFINVHRSFNYGAQRKRAYENLINKLKLKFSKEYYQDSLIETVESGSAMASYLLNLKNPPTAIICSHLRFFTGCLLKCQDLKLEIGKDISVVGFNDQDSFLSSQNLTFISHPLMEMGKHSVKMLQDLDKGVPINKVSTLIEPILNEGTSDKIKKPKL